MSKKVQISFTTDPATKLKAEKVVKKLHISLSTALNMCLAQINYQHGLPFSTKLPNNDSKYIKNKDA